MDDDGDGTPLVRRIFVTSLLAGATLEFAYDPARVSFSTASDGQATLSATMTSTASFRLKIPLPFETGRFTVTVDVDALSGAPLCSVKAKRADGVTLTSAIPAAVGVSEHSFPTVPENTNVSEVGLVCSGPGASMTFDWLTVSNGPYVTAPMNDVSTTATTMGLPGMGRQSMLRSSLTADGEIGSLMFVGSDVGGFAWTGDGEDWTTANGDVDDWDQAWDYAVWDAYALENSGILAEQDVFVLSGMIRVDEGDLWMTSNLANAAQTWTPIRWDDPGTVEPEDVNLNAEKHIDECTSDNAVASTPTFGKGVSSGHLMIPHPDDPTLVLVGSSSKEGTALWSLDTVAYEVSPVEFTNLPDVWNYPADGVAPNLIISALAIDDGGDWLLVGYRVVGWGSNVALYLCPADWVGGGACEGVSSGSFSIEDVRDIAAVPGQPGRFFVADGGRRLDNGAGETATCSRTESTVYAIKVDSSGRNVSRWMRQRGTKFCEASGFAVAT